MDLGKKLISDLKKRMKIYYTCRKLMFKSEKRLSVLDLILVAYDNSKLYCTVYVLYN